MKHLTKLLPANRFRPAGFISSSILLSVVAALWIGAASTARASSPLPSQEVTNAVITTFQEVLYRNPDAEGLTLYAAHLNAGKDTDWLRSVLRDSEERKQIERARRQTLHAFFTVPISCLLAATILTLLYTRTGARVSTTALILACLIFPLCYYSAVYHYTTNIPYFDDYDTLLSYSIGSASQRCSTIFSQSNEHRIFTARLVAEFVRLLTGQINFRTIAWIGNLSIAGLFIVFIYHWRKLRLPPILLCAVSAILFSLAAWKNMVWAIVAVQNNAVQLFAFLTFTVFFSSRTVSRTCLAFLCAALAAYSNGNGLFVLPALLIALFLRQRVVHRRGTPVQNRVLLMDSVPVLAALSIIAIGYFTDYHRPAHHPSILSGLDSPVKALTFFLRFMGGYFILPWPQLTLVAGTMFTGVSAFLLLSRKSYETPAIVSMICFLMMTGVIAALSRAEFGAEAALYPRYRINSILLICCLIAALAQRVSTSRRGLTAIILCITISWITFFWHQTEARPYLKRHQRALIDKSLDWYRHGSGLAYHNHLMSHAASIHEEATRQGIYTLPAVLQEQLNTD